MSTRIPTVCLSLFLLAAAPVFGQNLEGAPYTPGKDADIDLYMSSWTESMPRHTHGCLIERDILTRGDSMNPPRRGAVLQQVKRFAHATLNIRNTTMPTTLKGEQEVFYITGGKGIVSWKGKTADLFDGICFLAPEGLEFTMTNTGDEPLTMFVVAEPVPAGFTPKRDIVVKNENTFPIGTKDGHWVYQERDLFLKNDGLATLYAVITLTQDPMTVGHPHFHDSKIEEIWTTIKGNNLAFLGKQIRHQPPGTAYMIPPDGKTNHSNINQSKTEQIKMLYIATRMQ